MSTNTTIEWTEKTWNPVRGCSIVSPGCVNCYAMKQAHRFSGGPKVDGGLVLVREAGPYHGLTKQTKAGPQWTGRVRTVEDALLEPLSWRKPVRIFVNSMSDLFHEGVPEWFIDEVFVTMALAGQHTFQILTKRADRLLSYMTHPGRAASVATAVFKRFTTLRESERQSLKAVKVWPLPNVWLGVSVENPDYLSRLDDLRKTPAAVIFASFEPLLADLGDLARHLMRPLCYCCPGGKHRALDWVIVGGESGAGARPMHPAWPLAIRDQCVAAGVAFFFKQWGAWTPGVNVDRQRGTVDTATWFADKWLFGRENLARTDGHIDDDHDLYRVGKKASGRVLDGREWNERPLVQVPA